MRYIKNMFILMLTILLTFNTLGCGKKKDAPKDKQLNLYVDVKDKETLDVLKFAVEEYKKDNSKVKVTINNNIGSKIEEDLSKGSDGDLLLISRNTMLKLARKGLLNDMGSFYDENKMSEKYFTVVNAYGRFTDKYYGVPLIPYTIEILYNINALDKMKIKPPYTVSDLKDTFKKLNEMSIRTPVVLTDDIDIKGSLASVIVNNKVNMRKLESKYESGAQSYKQLTEMQEALDQIEALIKYGSINKNTFEMGNESNIKKFINGETPILIASSYYAESFKGDGVSIVSESVGKIENKINIPVICNCIICVPVSAKNSDEIGSFLKFITKEEFQKKLVAKGFVTGNKKANDEINDLNKKIVIKHLSNSTEDSVIYLYNLPEGLKNSLSSRIDKMIEGKYSKNEWNEIVDEFYK